MDAFIPNYTEINRIRIVKGEIKFFNKGKRISIKYKYNLDKDLLVLINGKDTKDEDWASHKDLISEYIKKESKRWLLS